MEATKFPTYIETAEEYAEFQRTGVLPDAAMARMRVENLERLRSFNEKRANANPMDDPTNWDKVPGVF